MSTENSVEHATPAVNDEAKPAATKNAEPNMTNILEHVKNLETQKKKLEAELNKSRARNDKLSQKTREGMQAALDTLMTKWMDAVRKDDDKVKTDFKCYTSVRGSANTSPLCACGSVKRERERFCANTSSVRVRIYVTEVDVGRCPYAHITIERSLRHLCLGIYCVA